MGTLQKFPPKCLFPPQFLINSIPSHSTPKALFSPTNFRCFCTSSVDLGSTHLVLHGRSCKKNSGVRARVGVRVSDSQLKENRLDSLSCPFMEKGSHLGFDGDEADSAGTSECVIGIDPDISGALAVLKDDGVGFSAQADESRKAASALFPSLSSLLKRKKDLGRAEALLIAAYGKGLKRPSESSVVCDASEGKPRDEKCLIGKGGIEWSSGYRSPQLKS